MIDYSKYTNTELDQCLSGIDKEKHHHNYINLLKEIEYRKSHKQEHSLKTDLIEADHRFGGKINAESAEEILAVENGLSRIQSFNAAVEAAIDDEIKNDFKINSTLNLIVIRQLKWNHAAIFSVFSFVNLVLLFLVVCSLIMNPAIDEKVLSICVSCILEILVFVFTWHSYYCFYSGLKYNIVRGKYSIMYHLSNKYLSELADFSTLGMLFFTVLIGCVIPLLVSIKYIRWLL